ncbi:S41 family peptidase [Paraglaciecola sp. 25GB23A]|uniref:S41 family peptidase n=1 Tax=Paraglaciecola sp. 25GB23A TaxID=3156068 RepID=UPI0032AF7547
MLRLTALLLSLLCISAHATQGYYRFPALHGDTLVFTAEGDLWKTTLDQPYAQRLTTHIAQESHAAISHDGQFVAFVANYTGSDEVYVMPLQGGLAKQVSHENVRVKLHGWTADGRILYSYNGRIGPTGNWSLRLVNPDNLVVESIPLADAVEGSIDSSGTTVYFTQFGLQVSSDNAHAYQGGAKGELWSYQLGSNKEANHLTEKHKGSARSPMVYQDRLYFISNQSGIDNLWSMKLDGRDQTQLTNYKDFNVRDARLDTGRIVYQLAADIVVYDIKNDRNQTLDLQLTSDLSQTRDQWVNQPLKFLTSAKQATSSKKVVLTARGRVAVASLDGSRLVEIATPLTSRTRKATLSDDNKWIYALNDSSGEMELWQYPADGSIGAKQLTFDGNTFRWNIYPSPDGKWLAHDDKNGDLWLLNLDTLKNRLISSRNNGLSPIGSLSWSHNSQLVAITREALGSERSQVMLIDITDDQSAVLTSEKYASYSPTFSQDDSWLYFLSDRDFNPYPGAPWGDRNMGASFDRRTQIFAISLDQEAKFAFAKPNELDDQKSKEKTTTEKNPAEKTDEENKDQQESSDDVASKDDTNEDSKEDITEENKEESKTKLVDWQNIAARLYQVPVPAGNYSNLSANKNFLYVIDRVTEPGAQASLKSIKISHKIKVDTFLGGTAEYSLSKDGESLFVRKIGPNNDMYIVSASAKFSSASNDGKVLTGDWKLHIQPKQEWQQIFHDAWLMHRDSLFDAKMRGLDWQAVKQKYQPLLDRLTERNELNDIFEQMMGELNTLHSQVRGGAIASDPSRPETATLGAQYEQTNQGLKITHIYSNDPEVLDRLAPLAKPGVNTQEGDIITAVNSMPINTLADLNMALLNQAGKQVLLDLKRANESLKAIVIPGSARDDYMLRYYDWVTLNQQKVQKTDDEIGYLHLRAMGSGDIETFAREFYAQYKKQGLIIDVRRNNGGNVDSWIIEKLLRRAWSFWQVRNGESFTNMQQTFRGHLVVLADQFTYSDGETFTAGIKALKLGTVIGKQTAGAGVWLTGRNSQSDNGMARVAEYPVFAMDGHWITEGHGIEPDIEVDNLPYATFNGQDAQLDAAIKLLKKEIKKNPFKPLKAKPLPKDISPATDILP